MPNLPFFTATIERFKGTPFLPLHQFQKKCAGHHAPGHPWEQRLPEQRLHRRHGDQGQSARRQGSFEAKIAGVGEDFYLENYAFYAFLFKKISNLPRKLVYFRIFGVQSVFFGKKMCFVCSRKRDLWGEQQVSDFFPGFLGPVFLFF